MPSKFSGTLNKKVLRREESAVLSGNPFSRLIRFVYIISLVTSSQPLF